MLFNSPEFLFCYLPLVLGGFIILGKLGRTAVIAWLAIASLVFYAYWQPIFVVLLLASIVGNYAVARLIWTFRERHRTQQAWLIAGICLNLGALGYFKYLFPLLGFINRFFGYQHDAGSVVLPLGISFFTFTQIAYLVDLSQDEAEPQDFMSYVLFVTFFPHLIAGPILHHREIMPQFASTRRFRLDWGDLSIGLSWFVMGLCKKTLIADRLAPFAESAFRHPGGLTATEACIGLLNYSMQLYFDFSGYSDMAVGIGRMFSIRLPVNFDSPYKAASIIEFWSRWHMTLTRYLTLYLYNPIAMWINRRRSAAGKSNSRKAVRTLPGFLELIALPTITTMFLAGVWHGAGLQFLIFGSLHGAFLTLNHAWRVFRRDGGFLTRVVSLRPVSMGLTFGAVLLGQVFFRAPSVSGAMQFLADLSGQHGMGCGWCQGGSGAAMTAASILQPAGLLHLYSVHSLRVLLLLPVVWLFPNTQEILGQAEKSVGNTEVWRKLFHWQPNLLWAGGLGVALVSAFWYMTDSSTFLYFQF